YCAVSEPIGAWTADRREFVGRNGTVAAPAGLKAPLAGTTGVGIDPCAALRMTVELEPDQTRELVVLLGADRGEMAAQRAIAEYCDPARARAEIDRAGQAWTDFAINCRTAWRSSTPSRRWPVPTSCARQRASSWKATCSTGGIPRPDAESEPDSPTTS